MTKIRCNKKSCTFNSRESCDRAMLTIIESPLYPDLASCGDFEEFSGKRVVSEGGAQK